MKDAAEAFVAFGSMVFSDAVMMQRLIRDDSQHSWFCEIP